MQSFAWFITLLLVFATGISVTSPPPTGKADWNARLNAIEGIPVVTLVEDIFVGGACKNIGNIRQIGNQAGIGYFENGSESIGIEAGIILSTGPVGYSEGPNNTDRKSGDLGSAAADPDLARMTNGALYDAVGLEFDFVPLDSVITFRYVFASEEYCEFVGDKFNDVFGFFVSGPGIDGEFSNGGENVALVPGTSDFVSINTINHLTNADYYVNNTPQGDAERCGIEWTGAPFLGDLQYDGFTRIFTAKLNLIPCQTYRLRMVVADVADQYYDSAVFLEAESFNIGGEVVLAATTETMQDTIFEGCDIGTFWVNRLNPEETDEPITINIKVDESSGAREGLDFASLPKTITIPAGETSVPVPVDLLIDDEVEGVESIVLELDFPCACISDTAKLYIMDPPLMGTGLEDQLICRGDSVELLTFASGGVPDYTYSWSTGAVDSRVTVAPEEDTEYRLTVTDVCGRQYVETVHVRLRVPPELTIGGGVVQTCIGETAEIPVYFFGSPPFSFQYRVGAGPLETVASTNENPYLVRTQEEGELEIVSYRDANCPGLVSGDAEVRHYRLQTIVVAEDLSCDYTTDGEISVRVVGGTPPYRFNWQGLPDTGASVTGLAPGGYSAMIADANDCTTSIEAAIGMPTPLRPLTFDCRAFQTNRLFFSARGGTPPYTYSLNGAPFTDASVFDTLTPGQRYDLEIQDVAGCLLYQDFIMPATYIEMITLPESMKAVFGETVRLEPELHIPESLIASIQWLPGDGMDCTDCLNPNLTAIRNGTVSIRIDDIFGCVGVASTNIKLEKLPGIFVPTAFSPNGDGQNDRLTVYANDRQVEIVNYLRIYNRWGMLLYEVRQLAPNDESRGWDGTFRGTPVNPGPFLYEMEVQLVDGSPLQMNGVVSVIR